MSFDNNTNHGRASKIVETLALIEKSATSNKATTEEVATMLAPVVAKLDALGVLDAPAASGDPAPSDVDKVDVPGGAWASDKHPSKQATLHDLAVTAPLKDLSIVMAVIMNRFDEFVGDHNG